MNAGDDILGIALIAVGLRQIGPRSLTARSVLLPIGALLGAISSVATHLNRAQAQLTARAGVVATTARIPSR